ARAAHHVEARRHGPQDPSALAVVGVAGGVVVADAWGEGADRTGATWFGHAGTVGRERGAPASLSAGRCGASTPATPASPGPAAPGRPPRSAPRGWRRAACPRRRRRARWTA